MSNTFFQTGEKNLGVALPTRALPGYSPGQSRDREPPTRLAQVRSSLPLPADAGCETC